MEYNAVLKCKRQIWEASNITEAKIKIQLATTNSLRLHKDKLVLLSTLQMAQVK